MPETKKPYGKIIYVRFPIPLAQAIDKIALGEFRTSQSVIRQAVQEFILKRSESGS